MALLPGYTRYDYKLATLKRRSASPKPSSSLWKKRTLIFSTMKKVTPYDPSILRRENVLRFFGKIIEASHAVYGETLPSFMQSFVNAYTSWQETAADREIRQAILCADEAADNAWKGLHLYLRALAYHPQKSKVTASRVLFAVLEDDPDPTDLPYDEEYAILGRELEAFHSIPVSTRKRACAEIWIDQLQNAYDTFMTAYHKGLENHTSDALNVIKSCRHALNRAWNNLSEQINVLYHLHHDSQIDQLIDQYNTIINEFMDIDPHS